MFTKDLKSQLSATQVLVPGSKANTAAATSTGVDTLNYEGDLMVVQDVGAVTGTLDGAVQDSADNVSFAPVSGLTFTQVTGSNNIQTLRVPKRGVRRYVRYLGTIVTGPIVMSAVMYGQLKTQ